VPVPVAEVRNMVTEHAEAYRLRVEWMALIGNGGQDIADSLRYNPSQSIVEEQGMLECVRTMQAQEKLEAKLLELARAEAGIHD
jgi:hypothetical protein